jgi:hypothetical protein
MEPQVCHHSSYLAARRAARLFGHCCDVLPPPKGTVMIDDECRIPEQSRLAQTNHWYVCAMRCSSSQHVLTSVRVWQSEFAISPGLEAALAEMDTAEAVELARKKTLAELLSAKRAELNSLVSIVNLCVY